MQMQQLRYFLEIAKEKNISAAAKNLYLSQPSLSQQIRKLEEELEVPLLIRHSKSVSLTDAGEQFAHHARRILGGVDQLSELMHKQSLLEAGTLKIGLLWIAGYTNLLQILSDYHCLHPGLNYSFSVNGSAHLQQMLLDRKIHAAFIIGTEEQLDQRYARIAELRSQEMRLQEELTELEKKGVPQVTMENIARVIEMWTKIPASKIKEEEFKRLAELDVRLKQHIVGQDEAVDAVSAAIRRSRVGISPKHKPVSFIFVGSTGVGKTELVKQLADDLFNSPDSLIRLDMSEFMEKHSVSRLVGSPPGYVGYDEAGQLTEKIRRKPYSVVLFDEIEKAHPDVLNILLQILDDGEVTDAHGRKVNFENTVIVMTSNAGSGKAAGAVGFGRSADDQDKERVMKALQEFLRPEFINRVDEIVYFHQLTEENFRGIAGIMLEELKAALEEKGYHFTYDDALVDYLVKKSYSAAYGARNLRRCIRKDVEDPMAARIIESYETPITQIKATAEDGAVKLYTL